MHIIGKNRFVIETKAPKYAKTKKVQTELGTEIVPDGDASYEYVWFCGIGAHPTLQGVTGAVWSPYPEQAHQYKDKEEAELVNKLILGPDAGGYVLSWETCHKAEGRQIIIPVSNAEFVIPGETKSGIKGGNLK